MKKNPNTAFVLLRFGLAIVFVWFACSQFSDPSAWTSYLPAFMRSLAMPATTFVLWNALFEIIAAVMLILGCFTRVTALLLALHLFGIMITVGLNAVGVRDFGLAIATLAIAFGGAGAFSIDTHAEAAAA